MNSPTVGFNSYVDIAICMVIQDSDRARLKQSVSKWCGVEEAQKSSSDWSVKDFEIHSPHSLRWEWSTRIREWQDQLPDRGQPVEECTSLNNFQFSALFLQHPFAAMSLWNAMQTFYTLDRLVCGTSKESLSTVTEWESMPPFEYLEAPKVEKRWRSSLQGLGREIKDGSHEETPVPQSEALFSSIADIGKNPKKGSKAENKSETLLRRIDGIYFGIAKLENAQGELRRNLRENLKGIKLVDLMLERIVVAARRRFSMIDIYLKTDEHHEVEHHFDDAQLPDAPTSDSLPQSPQFSLNEEPRRFKPLSRTNSMDVVKHQLVIAWVSTRRGDATASAIALLFILLVCLHQIQHYLIARSDI